MNSKRGTVIALVLVFASLMVVMLTAVLRTSSEQRGSVRRSCTPFQARLLALSGVQHLLLKAKLMPTELYDAWSLAKGRNPLFNFGAAVNVATDSNPGPRFVTRGIIGTDIKNDVTIAAADDFSTDPAGWFNNDLFAGNSWPRMQGVPVRNSQIYLWKFISDVNNKDTIQPALAVKRLPGPFDPLTSDPYTGTYEVITMKLLGQKDRKGYFEDTLNVEVQGTIADADGRTYTQSLTRSVNIQRR